jgi:hypothetical protein
MRSSDLHQIANWRITKCHTLPVYRMKGKLLHAGHGFPVCLFVPG